MPSGVRRIHETAARVALRMLIQRWVSKALTVFLEIDAGIKGADFSRTTDYIMVVAYLMARLGFPQDEFRTFLDDYQGLLDRYRGILGVQIYNKLMGSDARTKVRAAGAFVERCCS